MRDHHSPRHIYRSMQAPLARTRAAIRTTGELALGFVCLALLEVSGIAYMLIDEVNYRRRHPDPIASGAHRRMRS